MQSQDAEPSGSPINFHNDIQRARKEALIVRSFSANSFKPVEKDHQASKALKKNS